MPPGSRQFPGDSPQAQSGPTSSSQGARADHTPALCYSFHWVFPTSQGSSYCQRIASQGCSSPGIQPMLCRSFPRRPALQAQLSSAHADAAEFRHESAEGPFSAPAGYRAARAPIQSPAG
ncbi:hypothetical protein NDU88_006117 [Pleurodeles waltl]|uniref:Uncharacterized protein n=1 Tax=Pleurodeles waltl TaxID=8319 RepID=A0AAV7SNL0_PLEWA|nr:hypothetical protein NDU88_006117 [Pleurodeles waltl]